MRMEQLKYYHDVGRKFPPKHIRLPLQQSSCTPTEESLELTLEMHFLTVTAVWITWRNALLELVTNQPSEKTIATFNDAWLFYCRAQSEELSRHDDMRRIACEDELHVNCEGGLYGPIVCKNFLTIYSCNDAWNPQFVKKRNNYKMKALQPQKWIGGVVPTIPLYPQQCPPIRSQPPVSYSHQWKMLGIDLVNPKVEIRLHGSIFNDACDLQVCKKRRTIIILETKRFNQSRES